MSVKEFGIAKEAAVDDWADVDPAKTNRAFAAECLPKARGESAAIERRATVATATAPPSNGKSWRRDRVSGLMAFIPVLLPSLVRERAHARL
jgi:hypothetical protein